LTSIIVRRPSAARAGGRCWLADKRLGLIAPLLLDHTTQDGCRLSGIIETAGRPCKKGEARSERSRNPWRYFATLRPPMRKLGRDRQQAPDNAHSGRYTQLLGSEETSTNSSATDVAFLTIIYIWAGSPKPAERYVKMGSAPAAVRETSMRIASSEAPTISGTGLFGSITTMSSFSSTFDPNDTLPSRTRMECQSP